MPDASGQPIASDFLDELRFRLGNPAVNDSELLMYINASFRDVSRGQYSAPDYVAQILDTACQYLARDNKFPEISSISGGGVSTSFSSNDPERYRRMISARRQAAWI